MIKIHKGQILIAEDNANLAESYKGFAVKQFKNTIITDDVDKAITYLSVKYFDGVIIDIDNNGRNDAPHFNKVRSIL